MHVVIIPKANEAHQPACWKVVNNDARFLNNYFCQKGGAMNRLLGNVVLALVAVMGVLSLTGDVTATSIPAYVVNPSFIKTVDTDPNAYTNLGFEFTTSVPLTISHLGYNANQEFAGDRVVSITTDTGAALVPALTATVTVPTGGMANNIFVYEPLSSPYLLPAGSYWITAPIPAGMGYHFSNFSTDDTEVPGITYNHGIVSGGGSSARFYNVNFQFVPEPTSFALSVCGIAGLLAVARRTRSRNGR
jgi:hypothetical protein